MEPIRFGKGKRVGVITKGALKTPPEPKDYAYVRAWGLFMGSFEYYIRSEQRRAALDLAPLDAIYKSEDGKWVRFSDIQEGNPARARVAQYVKDITEVHGNG